ncbi:unnamed protein product [Protopolystoma xenopodis]|uniref:Uncharacterized protein n=1 Tax=Protopolystoma xenopodis TaxID=117903 RepID=A0A3S5BPS8_9PLAT|nr:unnamed protein product [Protopolystoma xenopodis]
MTRTNYLLLPMPQSLLAFYEYGLFAGPHLSTYLPLTRRLASSASIEMWNCSQLRRCYIHSSTPDVPPDWAVFAMLAVVKPIEVWFH